MIDEEMLRDFFKNLKFISKIHKFEKFKDFLNFSYRFIRGCLEPYFHIFHRL